MEADALRYGMGDGRRAAVLTAGLATLLALLFAAGHWFPRDSDGIEEGVLIATLMLGCAGALLALSRSLPPGRAFWLVTASACLLWTAAEGGRLLARSLEVSNQAQWFIGGIGALAVYAILLLTALRALADSSLIAWSLSLLDAAVVAIALLAPWLDLIVLPRIEDSGGWGLLPQLLAPALGGVVLVMGALALYVFPVRPRWAGVFLGALVVGLAGDLLSSRELLAGGAGEALGGWELRALLIVVATVYAGRPMKAEVERRLRLGVARLALVIVFFLTALVFAASAFQRGNQFAAFAVASTISVLLLFRLLLHSVDRHRHSELLVQALREQEQLAVMDALTGLYNRRFLDAELKLELDRSARSRSPVGILLCDLDHFKQVNDRYGHLVGDSVLREVARRLLGAVRNGDLVARYGGEEFVVLLPGGGKEQLREIGERCRQAFEGAPFSLLDEEAIVTISIGGACWPEDAGTAHRLFEAADTALYRAKELGRNRIYIVEAGYEPESPAPRLPATASAPQTWAVSDGERMQRWAALVARAMGLDEEAQRHCALAARFRDLGKTVLPESILAKQGPLSMVEWELVFEHADRGASMIELAPGLAGVANIIREHHERFDGRGYPLGKSCRDISTEARIVACCDAWSAMRNERPYAPAKTSSEARAELLAGRGTQFDPEVVMAFLMFDENEVDEAKSLVAVDV